MVMMSRIADTVANFCIESFIFFEVHTLQMTIETVPNAIELCVKSIKS